MLYFEGVVGNYKLVRVSVGWLCTECILSKFVDDSTLGGVVGLPTVEQPSLWMLRNLRTGPAETL